MRLNLRTLSVALALSTMTVLFGCKKQEAKDAKTEAPAQQKAPTPVVEVQVVELGVVPIMETLSGRVAAFETSEVRPQVGGIVDAVLFKEGSIVKKGQELYRINKDNYVSSANTSLASIATAEASLVSAKASLAAQEATLAQAQSDLARVQSLVGIDAVSKQMHDQYKTAVRTAQANVEAAKATVRQAEASISSAKAVHDASRLDIDRTIVRAPISGRIGISSVTSGALVSASQATPMVTISRTDVVYVDIQQSSSEMLRLRQQIESGKAGFGTTQVQLVLEDGEIYPLIGKLALSDAKVEQSTGTVTLRAVFENPNGVLIPGMYVNANLAQLVVGNAVLLPQTAVTLTPKGEAEVLVVNGEKKIEKRTVKTSGTFKGQWVVTEGLANGDAVVVMGGAKVAEGQAVEVKLAGQNSESAPQNPNGQNSTQNTDSQAPAPQAGETEEAKPQDKPAQQAGQNSVMAPQAAKPQEDEMSAAQKEAENMADSSDNSGK